MTILAVGGGTLGPVTPLLATWTVIKKRYPKAKLIWVGTPNGPERQLLEPLHIPFFPLPVAKWPRYPSLAWLTFPVDAWRARRVANRILDQHRSDVVMSAGGFTAVPIVQAARRRGIACVAHQLDLVPGLSNKRIAHLCQSVTTSFEYERPPFGDRVSDEWIATPTVLTMQSLPAKQAALRSFGFHHDKPVVFILGGGGGSAFINELVHRRLKEWLRFVNIIHSTGPGKNALAEKDRDHDGYHAQELFSQNLAEAYAAADLVIARGGVGTLSEASALKKPLIMIPLPRSPQEQNARACEAQGAVIVFEQSQPNLEDQLTKTIQLLLKDEQLGHDMAERLAKFFPTDDGTALAERVMRFL